LSKGKIPEVFLRGAGVPEEFITYMKSLIPGVGFAAFDAGCGSAGGSGEFCDQGDLALRLNFRNLGYFLVAN
jgi:hypothetical protein